MSRAYRGQLEVRLVEGLTDDDCWHLAMFQSHRDDCDFNPAIRLSWMRKMVPAVFRYLCRTDTECASVAVQQRWPVTRAAAHERTEAEIAAAAASVKRALEALAS